MERPVGLQAAEILADPLVNAVAEKYRAKLRRPFVHFGGPGTPFFDLTSRFKYPLRQAVVYGASTPTTTQEESLLKHAKLNHARHFPTAHHTHLKQAHFPAADHHLYADGGVPTSSWIRDQLNRQLTRQQMPRINSEFNLLAFIKMSESKPVADYYKACSKTESAVWPRHASERTAAVRGRSWAHRDERRDAWVSGAAMAGQGGPAAEDRVALMTTKRARVREQQVA